MPENSEDFFYLIDQDGIRRVPVKITAKDGRYGYAVHPKGKGNDASAAEYTTEEKRMVQAVVLDGRGVRCRARGGLHDGQVNTLGLTGRTVRGYWLKPEYHHWVKGVERVPERRGSELPNTAPKPAPEIRRSPSAAIHPAAATNRPTSVTPSSGIYCNQTAFRFADHCCQGGEQDLPLGPFSLNDLTIVKEGSRRLRFSPLGNRPAHPLVALVGITPGGQIERFAANLAGMSITAAAHHSAFYGAQTTIKELLRAHGLASHMGVTLEGDLNDNPDLLTTSIVKCCLMIDGGYRFSAPDIAASAAATHCATKRFVDDLLGYPTLKWVVIFGEPGWNALHELRRNGRLLIDVLRSAGLKVLQLPHFAQNFQQRALFCCSPVEEAKLLKNKPDHEKFAPSARRMRHAVLQALS